MLTLFLSEKNFELVIHLVEVLIWPITFFIVIVIFRTQLVSIIKRLGSINANSTGISMTFDSKVEAAKDMLNNMASSNVISKDGPISKEGTSIIVAKETPHKQLLNIQNELDEKLSTLAKSHHVYTEHYTIHSLTQKLSDVGAITSKKAKIIEVINDIIQTANEDVKQYQVSIVTELFESI